jgi:GTP-binding protein EngB required for normal cell division
MKNTQNQINHTSLEQRKEIEGSITVLDHQAELGKREKECLQFVKVPFFSRQSSSSERENEVIDICI